jgi:2-octaprenylphenol hydroxylase
MDRRICPNFRYDVGLASQAATTRIPLSGSRRTPRGYNIAMTIQTFDVAVVGGGLLGKTSALALAQSGLKVALLATPAQVPLGGIGEGFDSRVYAFSSSSRFLLEKLRVWQALDVARMTPVYDMRVFGDTLAQLHFSAFQASVSQLAWIVESGLVERALDTALHFQPQVSWIGRRAQGLSVGDQGAVLTLDDGAVLEVQLVIGADGAHSWVRAQTEAKLKQRDYRQIGVVANFRAALPHGETAYQWFRDGEIIALLPLPGQHVSLVWSARTEHAQALLALDPAQLAAELEQAVGQRLGALECVTPARGFPLLLQEVDRLIAPRVALVGDAAHAIHPLAGQGMNLGMRDVASLIDILTTRESFRNLGETVLLRRYERSRRADIQKLVLTTDGLQRLFAAPGAMVRGLRNTGMSLLAAQPWLKRWLITHALG